MVQSVNNEVQVSPLQDLVALLRLESIGTDAFRGRSCSRSLPFVFGGQVAAQSLAAAYLTVEDGRRVHSLHCSFVDAGDPREPLRFGVERVRDGRSFTLRRVEVRQGHGVVFAAMASFHADEAGPSYAEPIPEHSAPEALPPLESWLDQHRDRLPEWWHGPMAIDLRYPLEPPHVLTLPGRRVGRQQLWMRAAGEAPAETRIHDCVFTFATDLTLLDSVLLAHDRSWYTGEVRAASLDHAIWFHRPISIDSWLLYDQRSPAGAAGLGLATANVFTENGTLVASVAQQGVVRVLGG